MKEQIILLAISILGAFSLHAQEINEGLVQSKQEVISQTRKGTDWNKQPIGYVFAGAGIGYIPSVEKVEGLAASNYVTGLDWSRKDSDNLFFHNRLHRFSWFLAY